MEENNREIWQTLINYESSELVQQAFKRKHGLQLNAGKAREICTAFTLARSYMASASVADRSVRPLLAYYGVLSMSRALTLFLSRSLREAGLAQAHGLSVDSWGDELAKRSGDVAALRLKINARGTFRQLIEATEHVSLLRNNSSRPNYIANCEVPPADSEFTLVDLLSRLPEIRSSFTRWRTERNIVAIWPQDLQADASKHLRIDPPYTKADVEAVFGETLTLVKEQGLVLTYSAPPETTIPSISDCGGHWNVGTLVAMSMMPGGVELSKLTSAFAASYALGMLVRYYPSHWVAMLHNQRHDAALPTLVATLTYVETAVPRMVVEFLEREIHE